MQKFSLPEFCPNVHSQAVLVLPLFGSRLLQLLISNVSFFFIILILPKQYSLSTATLGNIPSYSHNMWWRSQAVVHTFLSSFWCTYKLLQMSLQRSAPMIYNVTLMYSLKLFLNLNRCETGCMMILFIYLISKQY